MADAKQKLYDRLKQQRTEEKQNTMTKRQKKTEELLQCKAKQLQKEKE